MTTIASVYKKVIINALEISRSNTLSIQELYQIAETNINFDDEDRSFVLVNGSPTKQVVWRRNLRNCLQTLKGNQTLENDLKGFWSLSNAKEIFLPIHRPDLIDNFLEESTNDDINLLQLYARKVRKGAPKLRTKLLQVYNSKCCISGTGPENVLQAAHIEDHALAGNNHSTNALLLRSDLHDLFDDDLLKIEPGSLVIYIHPSLKRTDYFLFNKQVILARTDNLRPSLVALNRR